MPRRTDPNRSRIQSSLLAQLQEGVAALENPEPAHQARSTTALPGSSASLSTNRAPRTTLSVPKHIGEQARRLSLAVTLHDQREATLGDTLERALRLLEENLRASGASIPSLPILLRSGPRIG
jgi:hypothetical protein